VPWLRIVEHGNDCRIVAGVDPAGARMGEQERSEVVGYDWEQVWRDARCTGVDGALPSVVRVRSLPSNPSVQELLFRIPNGLDVPRLKAAKNKLATASENGFVDIAPGPEPATVRLRVARNDPMPSSAPYRFELDPGAGHISFADGVDGEPVAMNLSEVAHLMLVGTSGGGKTTAGLALLQGALAVGAEVAVIDVQKGCADFRYVEPWCMAMAGELLDAAATMTALYAEAGRRRDLNAAHGVGSVRDLPKEIRPPDVFVFVDEFFGLITSPERPSTKPEQNPDLEAARLEALAAYNAKARIAYVTGRLGAEARSAGFHLVLMTQALTSKMKLPASIADLKLNSNRILLGKATHGERVSALRQPESAPDPGEVVPRGRAVYEPVVGEAKLVQIWHAPVASYEGWLEDNVEKVSPDELLDIEPHRMDDTAAAAFVITDEDSGGPLGRPTDGVWNVDDTAADAVPAGGVVVESSVEVFDDLDLPELADDETVDWSLVVGLEPPEDRRPPEVEGLLEPDPEPLIIVPEDEDMTDEPDGEADDHETVGVNPATPRLPVLPTRPTRAVVTGFDDEDDEVPTWSRRRSTPAPVVDDEHFGDVGAAPTPPARVVLPEPNDPDALMPDRPAVVQDPPPQVDLPPVPGTLSNPLAGLRRR